MPEDNLKGEFILSQEEKKSESAEKPQQNPPAVSVDEKTHNHDHNSIHFYSSLCHYPKGFTFKDQEADEEVILVVRQDFITNLPWFLIALFLAVLPPLFFIFSPLLPPFFQIPPIFLGISTAFYYTVLASYLVLQFTLWYFNVGIVTNKRIIDLDVQNILVKELTEARLVTLQDVTVVQVGGLRSIFNYGDINIQTEALHQNIEFQRAPDPNFIRQVVGDLIVNKPT